MAMQPSELSSDGAELVPSRVQRLQGLLTDLGALAKEVESQLTDQELQDLSVLKTEEVVSLPAVVHNLSLAHNALQKVIKQATPKVKKPKKISTPESRQKHRPSERSLVFVSPPPHQLKLLPASRHKRANSQDVKRPAQTQEKSTLQKEDVLVIMYLYDLVAKKPQHRIGVSLTNLAKKIDATDLATLQASVDRGVKFGYLNLETTASEDKDDKPVSLVSVAGDAQLKRFKEKRRHFYIELVECMPK